MDIVANKMDDYTIEEVGKELDFVSNSFQTVGSNLLLTVHEIEILDLYHIPYQNCRSLKEILFYIEDTIHDMDIVDQELEVVSKSIAERDYYQNTNK